MSERDDFKRTIVYGENAVGHLRKNEIPAYPRNYELWYTYAAGFNHALNKTINDIIRQRGKITPAEAMKVYDQFISPTRVGERFDEVGGRLSQEIAGVVGMIDKSMSNTSDYSNSLGEARAALADAKDGGAVEGIVRTLIDATHATEATNRALETQLAESRKQIADLQESLEAIRYESLVDDLTTLANRKHFDQTLERMMSEAEQSSQSFALLLTDIDHFKKFNDTFGHQTGDQVLRHELSHLLFAEASGHRPLPRWLTEGIAVHQSDENTFERFQELATGSWSQRLLPLARLDEGFSDGPTGVSLAYAQAADFTGYLLRKEGAGRFAVMLGHVRDGAELDEAARETWGSDLGRLEEDWRRDLGERMAFAPLWAGTGLLSLAGAAFVVVAMVRRWRRNRSVRARWEREERSARAARWALWGRPSLRQIGRAHV